jgi:hypothetical protein
LLGVEVGQDAVFRGLLLERLGETVPPYRNITVVEFTDRVSPLSNRLGRCRVKDKGLTVPRELGAICTNVLSTDWDSLSYPRTPAELLRILYLGYLGSSRIVKKELRNVVPTIFVPNVAVLLYFYQCCYMSNPSC